MGTSLTMVAQTTVPKVDMENYPYSTSKPGTKMAFVVYQILKSRLT